MQMITNSLLLMIQWPVDLSVFIGVLAWQRRVWDTVNSFTDGRSQGLPVQCDQHKFQEYEDMIYDFRNKGLVNVRTKSCIICLEQ